MNRHLYNILRLMPGLGMAVGIKYDFFYLKPSPYISELMKSGNYDILIDWVKQHPNQTLTPKMAEKLIRSKTTL